jgi:hypothetical protein
MNKAFSAPYYMMTVNSKLFITGNENIWKTDKYLNVLITHSDTNASYRDIYFNSTENLIYVASIAYTYFKVFDLNLTLKHNVSVSPNNPRSFAVYNNELYVGTLQGKVCVIVRKTIVRSFTGCSIASLISSMIFDNCGLIAISCSSNNLIDLFYSNGTFAGKKLNSFSNPEYIGFDSKGRFVLISKTQISIYY